MKPTTCPTVNIGFLKIHSIFRIPLLSVFKGESVPQYYELPFNKELLDVDDEHECIHLCYANTQCVQAVYFVNATEDHEIPAVAAKTCFLQDKLTLPKSLKRHRHSKVYSILSKYAVGLIEALVNKNFISFYSLGNSSEAIIKNLRFAAHTLSLEYRTPYGDNFNTVSKVVTPGIARKKFLFMNKFTNEYFMS